MAEAINHPNHYHAESGVEVIDVIEDMGLGFGFDVGSAIKYIARAGAKVIGGMTPAEATIQDLKKAVWYLDRAWNDKGARTCEVPLITPREMAEAWGLSGLRVTALTHIFEVVAGTKSVRGGLTAAISAITIEIGRLENGVGI